MTVSDTERLTTYANATDTEKRLSETVADELGIAPTYTDERGVEWPLVQQVDPSIKDYSFWLGDYGGYGTVTNTEESWSVLRSRDGVVVDKNLGDVRDAALVVQDLEEPL
jgi:hypothetical protein